MSMTGTCEQHLLTEVNDGVAVITLNRPDRLNTLTDAMSKDFLAALKDYERDESVRVIVVTGAGGNFCAGLDLKSHGDDTFANLARVRESGAGGPDFASFKPWDSVTPVIGALNGFCVGLGASFSLLFDVRFAGDDAQFGFVFPRRGLPPELNISWLLPRVVGVSNAADVLLSGRRFTADEAFHMGLVSRVVPADKVLDTAVDYAREIAEKTSPAAVAATKRLLWRNQTVTDPNTGVANEAIVSRKLLATADVRMATKAFLEKKPPTWTSSKHDDLI